MSTFMPNAETVERKWYILDAAGKPLGRVAAKAAHILRGKGMLPNNTLGRKAATRMRLYAGAEHKNGAQKPEEFKY